MFVLRLQPRKPYAHAISEPRVEPATRQAEHHKWQIRNSHPRPHCQYISRHHAACRVAHDSTRSSPRLPRGFAYYCITTINSSLSSVSRRFPSLASSRFSRFFCDFLFVFSFNSSRVRLFATRLSYSLTFSSLLILLTAPDRVRLHHHHHHHHLISSHNGERRRRELPQPQWDL